MVIERQGENNLAFTIEALRFELESKTDEMELLNSQLRNKIMQLKHADKKIAYWEEEKKLDMRLMSRKTAATKTAVATCEVTVVNIEIH
jgi:hypothetical protein